MVLKDNFNYRLVKIILIINQKDNFNYRLTKDEFIYQPKR